MLINMGKDLKFISQMFFKFYLIWSDFLKIIIQ